MVSSGSSGKASRQPAAAASGLGQVQLEHYLRLLMHRKWLIIGVFIAVSLATIIVSHRLPDVFTSETLILVDPQKVPEEYVKSTVTGDVRNRLGTLSQQILSTSRLQKIIENLNLYPEERKKMAREDITSLMRGDISVRVVSDFGAIQDLQAFKISYSGGEPRLVAQVANQLATLFIDENLKAREIQATGTTEFLANQLQETRRALETQEAKLRDFKLKHIGEMPEQQTADIQMLGQVQAQLQLEGDALSRVEQQRTLVQSMLAQSAPIVDLDDTQPKPRDNKGSQAPKPSVAHKAQLAALLTRYSEKHPDVLRLKREIEEEDAREAKEAPAAAEPAEATPVKRVVRPPVNYANPVLQSQLRALDAEVVQHKEERQRLSKLVAAYRAKLDAIPVREQEITALERDYQMSKNHYSKLLDQQLSANTATQLEIRQKGEKFEVLDTAQPAERPSHPNRLVINLAGGAVGLALGLALALVSELFGMAIIDPQDVTAASGLAVLGVIPVIQTQTDKRFRRVWMLVGTASVVVAVLAGCVILLFGSRLQI